ncbi:Fc receptor-like protein 5 isoform X4 [Trematomus bernacchii]|nr:Fc receptor-like protein 5 isoform X4 [Trematomus bernacchii]
MLLSNKATLRVLPNKSQFFRYESVSFSCEGNSSEWKVKRNTSKNTNEDCPNSPEKNPNHFVIDDLYTSDSGVYWCESEPGRCSNSVNITVTGGSVILESPSVPVMEGESVTLICRNQTSTLSADFYKDGRLISSSSSGNITIHRVSKSDEGLYKCNISDGGQSPDSWLAVRAAVHQESPAPPSLVLVLLPVFGVCLALGSLMLLGLWRNHKGEDEADVDYTNVTVTQEGLPIRIRDADTASTYSTVRT